MDVGLVAGAAASQREAPRRNDVALSVECRVAGAELLPNSSFARLAAAVEEPFTTQRLLAFLAVHLAAFGAEVFSIVNFWFTNDLGFFVFLLAPFLFSGFFCAHAAWHCEAPAWAPMCLPLKKWSLPVALLLALPFGFFQGVIVLLALEDYTAKRHHGASSGPESPGSSSSYQPPVRPTSNKFHCKAVNGLFEGLVSSAVLLYAFWTCGYPVANPITKSSWRHERTFLAILGWALLLSSGLGLLELDFCTSRAIARRMKRSLRYEVIHGIFRTSEVVMRVSLYIWFMVTMRLSAWWWWVPTAADVFATVILVTVFGGAESTFFVRLLCSVPCLFANVFLFIDSPYKRRAARRLSRWLTCKNAITLVLLPALAIVGGACPRELDGDWDMHHVMIAGAMACVPIYWFLLWWISARSMHRHNMPDIYSACESGSVAAVRSAIRDLTHSAAVGLNVNCADTDGNTPLMLAAAGGHSKVCRLLLQEGAYVDAKPFDDGRPIRRCLQLSSRRRWTALHMAAWRGHAEVLRVLLEDRGAVSGAGQATQDEDLEVFQDTAGDTPLHIAARGGHAEAVRAVASRRPAWVDALNARHQRPVDLTREEAVQRAISCPAPAAVERGRCSPLLLRQQSPAHPAQALASPSAAPAATAQAWPQVQLPIARASREETHLVAPGLCSYVASSCGGALGRVFLANAPSQYVPHAHSVLTSISEASEDDGHAAAAERLPRVQLPLAPPQASRATGPAAAAGTAATASSGGADTGAAGMQQPGSPNMEDLEPIDDQGEPINRWAAALQNQRLSAGPMSSGRSIMKVPCESVLGEGSYGLVWRAKDRHTHTWYAVKNIKTQRRGAPSVATRECEVADHVRLKPHPCIVRLYHVHNFTDTGLYALVMEFCPGGDLLGRVRQARQAAARQQRPYQPPPPSLLWVGQVFLGLEHMHLRMETLLRDLKPENVVLSARGCAKLTDFGFGRFGVESSGCWSFGIPTGSPGYVAPEVLRREEYDCRADLYSLGVLVWVLLTGGLTNSSEPTPPLGKMRHATDFEAHFQDCQRLAQCIADPERHNARRLREDARDFVARLTHRRPEVRMRHPDIRAHRLLQPLRLPAYDAPPTAVEAWLRSAAASTDPGSSAPAG